MGTTSRWLVLFSLVAAGACTDQSGCNTQPLPGGALPADQTLEGGAQLRVTRQGLMKVASIIPGLVNDQVGDGFCLPEDTQASVHYCYEDQNQCNNGCDVDVSVNSVQFLTPNTQTLTMRLDLAADAVVPTDAPFFDPCYLTVVGDHVFGDADIELIPDATTGELTVRLAAIRNLDLSQLSITGNSGFCSGASAFADFLKDYFEQEIADFLAPRVNDLLQDFIPDPLGLEGVVDMGPLLAGISPGTQGALEARVIPGGFASVTPGSANIAQGVSLGVITGFNADEDPSTRTAALDSEPSLCVPPILPPLFGGAPWNLSTTTRNTFQMPVAPAFNGTSDPAGSDLSVGISEVSLDLIGHHAVTSGAMCLGIGTSLVEQLNVGTFGILVPSVAALGSEEGTDPLLLVTRPQKAVDFTVGDNTPVSPALTLHLKDFELDVYPFLFERYTRAFTMVATLDVGVNVEFEQATDGTWSLKPTLVGLTADEVTVKVTNNEFVAESAAQLEGALPSVFDLLTTQLTIPPVELPTFAGFGIDNPSLVKSTSPQGPYLTIYGDLDVTGMAFAGKPARATGTAKLREVVTPAPAEIRTALAKQGGALPRITLDVDRTDAHGRALEWSWRIGNGMWRPYVPGGELTISDRALVWQGMHSIGLISRRVGEPGSSSSETRIPVVIDSVGPQLVTSKTGWNGETYEVRGWDIVGKDAIKIAFGAPGDDEPRTAWQTGATATLSRADAAGLAIDGDIQVFLEDAQGNRTLATVAPGAFHGQAGASGCNCDAGSGGPAGGTVLLAIVTLGGVLGSSRGRHRRRRRW